MPASLAAAFLDHTLDPDVIAAMDDETAVATIAAVRGLGRWTAEVYLLFALGRHDVFPTGDIALAASAAHLKGLAERARVRWRCAVISDAWRPARSLAARLLWHRWRHVTRRPALDDFPVA